MSDVFVNPVTFINEQNEVIVSLMEKLEAAFSAIVDREDTIEQLRADADAKDRSHQATIADLQAQLSAKENELQAANVFN